VNIVLDSTNYTSWRDLMEQALQRYALIKHITDDTPSNDPGWRAQREKCLHVKNAFLHVTLSETVFCCQPTGFADPAHPDLVCRLRKSLYELRQASRA
jgi:hypothetical protein